MTEQTRFSPVRPRARFGHRACLGAAVVFGVVLATPAVPGPAAVAQAPSAAIAAAASVEQTAATKVRTLQDPRITESSSLAKSAIRRAGCGRPTTAVAARHFMPVGKAGKTVRTFELTGASHLDWEGMARSVIGE